MASVFSFYVSCFHYSSDHDDHLTHSPRAGHCCHSPHHILDSSSTVELICLLIASIVRPLIRIVPHLTLRGTAANDADVSTRKPRRFL